MLPTFLKLTGVYLLAFLKNMISRDNFLTKCILGIPRHTHLDLKYKLLTYPQCITHTLQRSVKHFHVSVAYMLWDYTEKDTLISYFQSPLVNTQAY